MASNVQPRVCYNTELEVGKIGQPVVGDRADGLGCKVSHSHISFDDLKKGLSEESLNDDQLFEILAKARLDIEVFDKHLHKIIKGVSSEEEYFTKRQIYQDELIVKLCEQKLLQVQQSIGAYQGPLG